MAQTKVKKKPAGKAAPKKAARAKPAPKKAPAKKAAKPVAKAKPAAKTKVAKATKPVKAAAKKAPARKSAPATAAKAKRPVAVSHRPQSAVAVQSRPAKPTTPASVAAVEKEKRPRPSPSESTGGMLTEEQIRKAPDSAYMNDAQLAFFQERLLQMRAEVLTRELDVKERLHQREVFADPADRASAEEEHWLDLRLRERESLLLKKIDDALRRIRDREYGYCEKTGEPIGIARLLARPTATVCVDIKGQTERAESQYRDR